MRGVNEYGLFEPSDIATPLRVSVYTLKGVNIHDINTQLKGVNETGANTRGVL